MRGRSETMNSSSGVTMAPEPLEPATSAPWGGIVQTASAALAALPGLASLVSGLAVPDDLRVIFGAFYSTIGTLVVMLLWGRREAIVARSRQRNRLTIAGCIVLSLVSFGFYQWGYQASTLTLVDRRFDPPTTEEFRFPLFGADSLNDMVKAAGSRTDAVVNELPDRFRERLQQPDVAPWQATTDLLLLVLFLGVSAPLANALGLAALEAQRTSG